MRLIYCGGLHLAMSCLILGLLNTTLIHSYTQDEIDNAWKKMIKRETFFKSIDNKRGCWPNKVIPYTINKGFSPDQVQHIVNHMHQIQNKTCVRFVEKNTLANVTKSLEFIHVNVPLDCYTKEYLLEHHTEVRTIVKLGDKCFPMESVIHEMMHALGFVHEHQRIDRDCYVEVDEYHARETLDFKIVYDMPFEKWPYDKRSITHYTRMDAYGLRDKEEPLNGLLWKYRLGDDYGFWGRIGRRTGKLTCLDVHKINFVYCGAPDFCDIQPKMCQEVEEDEVKQGCKKLYQDLANNKVRPNPSK